MKPILAATLILFASFAFAAVSLDEIVKLSQLKTSDDVILQLIQKEGLADPITSKDVVILKEKGVSDRVVQYMLKVSKSASHQPPAQKGESVQLGENMRSYYTTGKDGKRVRVVTNLDEQGKRMGGEVLPEPEPPQQAQQNPPQEVRVVVENGRNGGGYYEQPPYPEPEYIDDRYLPPSYFPPSYSQYPYYSSYEGYSPYFYDYPYHHNKNYRPRDPNAPTWRYDLGLDKPRPQPAPRQGPVQNSSRGRAMPSPKPSRH